MPNYTAPGVYIEEVSTGPRPIEAVGTSVAGFIGQAPAEAASIDRLVWCDNWSQFRRTFAPEGTSGLQSTPLSHAVFGFFLNGGTRCAVVNTGPEKSLLGDGKTRKGIVVFEQSDAISIIVAPGCTGAADYDAVLSHCEKMQNRIAILDGPAYAEDISALTRVASVPADGGGTRRRAGAEGEETAGLKPRPSDRGFGSFYFPHIHVIDPLAPKADPVAVAPSGHIAGLYADTDATRGVHKAPANVVIRGALGVTHAVTRQEQEQLNPEGVNCIRQFSREGIRVFGARTLAPSASEWRYLNVRRLFIMAEESIGRGTRWSVFEPNNYPLWQDLRFNVRMFLLRLFEQGALMGRTPDEAFFVQCDEETNPPESVDAGEVIIRIGLAPVKPAEFVIFKIGQTVAGTTIETP
jgi:uncharacterized protein